VSKDSFWFDGRTTSVDEGSNRSKKKNVQRPSGWIERVVWSPDGTHFAAAAGKKVMINGRVFEVEGTVYDVAFLPTRRKTTPKNDGGTASRSTTPTRRLLAIALYGGVTLADTDATTTVWHRRFTVGSSAVLSFAISPDGSSIGIGCLDKRLRVFEHDSPPDAAAVASTGGTTPEDGAWAVGDWNARDWIGFDGGATRVGFSPDNRRLAALGGSVLLVIDRSSEWGEAPIVCCSDRNSKNSAVYGTGSTGGNKIATEGKFQSFAWSTKDVLIASTNHFVHVFDVRATIDTVPKRCHPIASVPIEKGFGVTDVEGEILVWGKSGIRKLTIILH